MSLINRYEFLNEEEFAKLQVVEQTKPSMVRVPELQLDYEIEINKLLFALCRKGELLILIRSAESGFLINSNFNNRQLTHWFPYSVNGGWFSEHRKLVPFMETDKTSYLAMLAAYGYPTANLRQLEGVVMALSEYSSRIEIKFKLNECLTIRTNQNLFRKCGVFHLMITSSREQETPTS